MLTMQVLPRQNSKEEIRWRNGALVLLAAGVLLHSLEQCCPPAVTGMDGKLAVELILSIYASSFSGKEVLLQ